MNKLIYTIAITLLILGACTSEEKVIPAPEIFVQMPEGGFDFDVDSTEIIEPKITYDINGEYIWSENGSAFYYEKIYNFKVDELGSHDYTFEVETPYGTDQMAIPVHALHINTFEEEEDKLNDNGYFNNPEAGYHEYKTYIRYPADYDAAQTENWSGFALSENTNKTDATINNEFSVYNSSGADESDLFTVFKESETIDHRISFHDGNTHTLKSVSVNNNTYTYLTILNGFDKKEGKDFVLLTITGYDAAGSETNNIEFYLSDYRPTETAEKFIISEWNKLDLSSLGNVQSIGFKITSSVDDDPNFILPKYVCIDNLKVKS